MDDSKSHPFPPAQHRKPYADIVKIATDLLAATGEEALELAVGLLAMVIVERSCGPSGLGIYAFLSACLYAVRYAAGFGVARYVENEIAATEAPGRPEKAMMGRGYQAVWLTGLAASLLLLLSAGFDTSHTRIEERFGAYLILAVIVPLSNLNHLKLSILQGLGQHTRAARLRMIRYAVFLAAVFFASQSGVKPSFLLAAYIPADLLIASMMRRTLQAPAWWRFLKNPHRALETLANGYPYLFTDNALDLLLNMDLFVLGLFVGAGDLGIYAEAAVLVRAALLVPVAIKPILRRYYNRMMASGAADGAVQRYAQTTTALFCLNALLALYTVLHYEMVLDLFFNLKGGDQPSVVIFTIFIPGLIYFGAFSAQEPMYDAVHNIAGLKVLTMATAAINLMLTLYLVPMAGIRGAAVATMLSMLAYFGLFRPRPGRAAIGKRDFLAAGLTLYLVYMLLGHLRWPLMVTLWLAPLMVVLLFYLVGLFGTHSQPAVKVETDFNPGEVPFQ